MMNEEGETMKSKSAKYALGIFVASFVIVLSLAATGLF